MFDCMVPYHMVGKPLGFLLIEYLFVLLVFVWEIGLGGFYLFWVDCNAPNKILITVSGAWYVLPPWGKNSPFRVVGTKNYR